MSGALICINGLGWLAVQQNGGGGEGRHSDVFSALNRLFWP
jgi:hypothetical protein